MRMSRLAECLWCVSSSLKENRMRFTVTIVVLALFVLCSPVIEAQCTPTGTWPAASTTYTCGDVGIGAAPLSGYGLHLTRSGLALIRVESTGSSTVGLFSVNSVHAWFAGINSSTGNYIVQDSTLAANRIEIDTTGKTQLAAVAVDQTYTPVLKVTTNGAAYAGSGGGVGQATRHKKI